MKKNSKRSLGLVAIIIYKILQFLFLAAVSLGLVFAVKNHQELANLSENYLSQGRISLVRWLLEIVLNQKSDRLELIAIATAIYAIVSAIEAIGLWYQKGWARILVICLIGIGIPAEIIELFRGISLVKLGAFLANTAVFLYLLRHSFTTEMKIKDNK